MVQKAPGDAGTEVAEKDIRDAIQILGGLSDGDAMKVQPTLSLINY